MNQSHLAAAILVAGGITSTPGTRSTDAGADERQTSLLAFRPAFHRPGFARLAILAVLAMTATHALADATAATEGYRLPPPRLVEIVDAPAPPVSSLNPRGGSILLCAHRTLVDLAYHAQPLLRLAGCRFLPATNGAQRSFFVHEAVILPIRPSPAPTGHTASAPTGPAGPAAADAPGTNARPDAMSIATGSIFAGLGPDAIRIDLSGGRRWGMLTWSPDGTRLAGAHYADDGIEVWVFDAATGRGRPITRRRVNTVLMPPFTWLDGGRHLLVPLVPAGRGPAPRPPAIPSGPLLEETAGAVAKVRTFADLLRTAFDEELFCHHATSQLAVIDVETGTGSELGKPGVYRDAARSPDGRFWLIDRATRPMSRMVPIEMFAHALEIWDATGAPVTTFATLPAEEQLPIQGVATGPRAVRWQPLQPATLVWTEALDDGDPSRKVPYREQIRRLAAPFKGPPEDLWRLPQRFAGWDWLPTAGLVLCHDYDRDRKWITGRLFDTRQPTDASAAIVLIDRSIKDDYGDPGNPVDTVLPDGQTVARVDRGGLWMTGRGATPDGLRPFLRHLRLDGSGFSTVFQSGLEVFERVDGFADASCTAIITIRESPTQVPNHAWRPLRFLPDGAADEITTRPLAADGAPAAGLASAGPPIPLTWFPDPAPELTAIRKELLSYRRDDGVPLSGTLYLPPDYRPGQRVPAVVWAYPREYTDVGTAGQVRTTPNRFTRLEGDSILFMLLRGYAVLMNAEIPVVGDPLTANDTYVPQITAAARAAVDELVRRGIAERHRIAIAGHSYGAFMVANLLAHTDLFAAGIARSGAYNRTLTPFGFQGERRTYWEAVDVYTRLSPFTHADKIDEPLLLIHGEIDDNPGTFPMQSERLFAAIRGHGGTARLVILPHESHHYLARESVLHVLAEMGDWLDRHVRNRPVPVRPGPAAASTSEAVPPASASVSPR